jgi:hypothetical protein
LIYSGSSSTGSGGSADSTEIDDMLFSLYTELQKEDCMVEKIRERFADIGINITLEEVGINQSKQLIWQANFELVVETKSLKKYRIAGYFCGVFSFCLFSRSNVNRQNKFREIFIQNLYF